MTRISQTPLLASTPELPPAKLSGSGPLRNFLLGLVAVFLTVIAIYPEFSFGSASVDGAIWIPFSALSFLLAPLRWRRERTLFPDPFWILAVLYILYFPARFAFLYYGADFTTEALQAHSAVEAQGFRALRMATLAGTAIYCGGALTSPPIASFRLITRFWNGAATSDHVGCWLAIGYFAALWRFAIARSMSVWEFSHHGSVGIIFVLLLDCGIVASAAAIAFARERGQRMLAIILLAVNGVAMYQYAFKEPIIMLLFFVLVGWSYRNEKKSWTSWVKVIVFGIVVLFVIFPVVQSMRKSVEQGEGRSLDSVADYFGSRLDGAENTNRTEMVLASLGRISQRFHGVESMSTILDHVPDKIPHAGMSSIGTRFAWTFVPRFVSADKPQIQQGPMFNREFIGVQSDTPIAIFQIAEAYFVAGPIFLVAIALFQGWFGRLLCRLRANLPWERSFPYICLMLWALMGVERDIVLTWTTLPRTMLIFASTDWLLRAVFGNSIRRRRPARVPQFLGPRA